MADPRGDDSRHVQVRPQKAAMCFDDRAANREPSPEPLGLVV
jgi:hypothetical protein